MGDRLVVVKVGSTSVTTTTGEPDTALLESLARQVAELRAARTSVVVVTSGAVALGLTALGIEARPTEMAQLQAASAVGQHRVVRAWQDALEGHGLVCGQVLLDPADLFSRGPYLLAGRTFAALLAFGAVPLVNENDAVADQEIRFGDNDRLAALVAVLVGADRLVMLTDTPGLFTADPARFSDATLIDVVAEIDQALLDAAGASSSAVGTGGMASKLTAARLATWSGIETVVADARAASILTKVCAGETEGSTVFRATKRPLAARKAWLAFATVPRATLVVDAGARRALESHASLLLAGVTSVEGQFLAGDAVEVADEAGSIARGLARLGSADLDAMRGDGPAPRDVVVVHRDDLVVLV